VRTQNKNGLNLRTVVGDEYQTPNPKGRAPRVLTMKKTCQNDEGLPEKTGGRGSVVTSHRRGCAAAEHSINYHPSIPRSDGRPRLSSAQEAGI